MSAQGFTPTSYPICLSDPLRLVPTPWASHIPFALCLVEVLRPRLVVELGTGDGVSYCAFCQAVKQLQLKTRCYGVNRWPPDSHGDELLADLKLHHDPLYADFSMLIQSSFDDALAKIQDNAVDLLHIDGCHNFDRLRHDFESWLPKMSDRGVILLHNTNLRERHLGAWRFWEEIRPKHPHFEFLHENGLGVISIGPNVPSDLLPLMKATETEAQNIRYFFEQTGQRLRLKLDSIQQQQTIHELEDQISEQSQTIDGLTNEVAARDTTVTVLTDELTARDARINAILTCRAWRWSQRVSRMKKLVTLPFSGLLDRFHTNGKSNQLLPAAARISSLPHAVRPPALSKADARTDLRSPASVNASGLDLASTTGRLLPDVICFSIVDWDFRYQRPQQVMSQFAANGHRVFVIRLDKILPFQSRPGFSVTRLKENVYELTLAALRAVMINQEQVKGANADTLCSSLGELRTAYGIGDAIAYVMTPSWTHMAEEVQRRWGWRVIYDCMDDWDGFPGFGRLALHGEERLVASCDLLVVTAERLVKKWQKTGRQSVLARNGVDFDFYQERCQPNKMLVDTPHPIVGYFGAIADWFDLDLMISVARRRPNLMFVLLGGVFEVDVTELRSLPNVRVLGQQPYETMPQYLFHFDVCVIPFKINNTTQATDPVKVYEYLSAGKPVVTVDLPELDSFRELLYVAHDRDEFVAQLDKAVAENDQAMIERRRAFAAENTWGRRYDTIMAGLREATPLASLVVVTYNGLAMTKLCLESVIRNTDYPNFEIVVVDNQSNDATAEYLQRFASQHDHVKVLLNAENRGFPKAVNQGISESAGEYLVILNNDTVVSRGWLSGLLRHLHDPAVGLVGPVTNSVGNEAKISTNYRTLDEMEEFADEWVRTRLGQVADIHMLAMFCVAMRRATHDSIGALDEQFGIGMFEDDDYSLRAKAAGLRVICAADVFVHHFGQAAFKKLIDSGEYEKIFTENRRRYESKWNVTWIGHKNGALRFESATSRMAEP
jgi:GT2 family glycosyltransferase/glycosyltransferase involved in cell wall biosynthesis/uncharacterized coiled-coil protein SlyX